MDEAVVTDEVQPRVLAVRQLPHELVDGHEVSKDLRDRGVAEDSLARVHAPAGLDLGHIPNQEIAVAILAELVQLRAGGRLEPPPVAEPPHEAIDPVCGMTVDVASARYATTHEGRTYYFCSAGCLERFTAAPAPFLAVATEA